MKNEEVPPLPPASTMPDHLRTDLLNLYKASRLEDAEASARSCIVQYPLDYFGWKMLGALLSKKGKIAEALLPLKKAIELNPKDAEYFFQRGLCFKAIESHREAVEDLKKALDLAENQELRREAKQELEDLLGGGHNPK